MKFKKLGMRSALIVGIFSLIAVITWSFSTAPDKETEEKLLMSIMVRVMQSSHFNQMKIDDDFSAKVHDMYIKRMDFGKMYFLQSDIKKFANHKTKIDDYILAGDLSFYHEVRSTFDSRLEDVKEMTEKILSQKIPLDLNETYQTDAEKREYPANSKEQKEVWRKYLRYSVLNSYLIRLENQEKAIAKQSDSSDTEVEIKSEEELLAESIKQVKKNMNQRFERREEIDDEDNFAIFLNAISASYGPHSEYFPPQQKENFDLRMTGTLEGIGAVLTESDGYIKINSIVTGSACWRQGELEAGDLILKVAQGGDEPVDIVDAPMKEALKLIRGKKGTEVRLTVQKDDGEIKVIPIVRDVVIREETYAKSAVIDEDKSGNKFGYIFLPSFYSKFGKEDGRKCSEDVRKELEKLKAENVKGVILDLRNNGGGSLPDAVEMAGLFFEKGPVVQVKATGQKPQVRGDFNSSVTYDGPLIVMINTFSASASEIVSGALKDYDRAVVVGSNTSYGKGTVQTIVDLNRYVNPTVSLSQPFGSLKFTVQQFYRVNGSSTQFKGVASDISFPDVYSTTDIGEKTLDFALPWDSVQSAQYNKWSANEYAVNDLRKSSTSRMQNDELFQAMEERNEWIISERDNTELTLSLEEMKRKREERKQVNKAYNDLDKINENMHMTSLQEITVENDTVAIKREENWIAQLEKDLFLQESIYILNDMLQEHKKINVASDDQNPIFEKKK